MVSQAYSYLFKSCYCARALRKYWAKLLLDVESLQSPELSTSAAHGNKSGSSNSHIASILIRLAHILSCTKSILIKSLLEFFYPLGLGKPINLHYFLTSTWPYFNFGEFWSEVVELFRCVVVKVFKILLFSIFDAPWMLKIFCC